MLSDSEADYDAFDSPSERADKRLFSPNFWVRRIYPIYMLLMLFVFVFYMPYRVAFHPRERYRSSPRVLVTCSRQKCSSQLTVFA